MVRIFDNFWNLPCLFASCFVSDESKGPVTQRFYGLRDSLNDDTLQKFSRLSTTDLLITHQIMNN